MTRLLDLGIEPYLVASSVVAVLAQRLVRKVCLECARDMVPDENQLWHLYDDVSRMDMDSIVQGAGCKACRKTGYRGRIGLFELLVVDEAIRDQIQARANASQIRDVAVRNGMRLLRHDGTTKIIARTTTIDEVVRVTMRTTL